MLTPDIMRRVVRSPKGKFITSAVKILKHLNEEEYNLPSIREIGEAFNQGKTVEEIKINARR